MNEQHFAAPWSRKLKWFSGLITAVIVIPLTAVSWGLPSGQPLIGRLIVGVLPILILGGTAVFSIRGYTLTAEGIVVQRPIGPVKLPWEKIKDVTYRPDVTEGSLRLFGNGGLYSWIGVFRNQKLGRYRAYITDGTNTVVLEMRNGRTIVLSPAKPKQFTALAEGYLST